MFSAFFYFLSKIKIRQVPNCVHFFVGIEVALRGIIINELIF